MISSLSVRLHRSRPTRRAPRRAGSTRLHVERVEDRLLLSSGIPHLVADLNLTLADSNPTELVALGSGSFFAAEDGIHGVELWKSDGTAAGTALVKDINPGRSSAFPRSLINANGTLFFTADDGTG